MALYWCKRKKVLWSIICRIVSTGSHKEQEHVNERSADLRSVTKRTIHGVTSVPSASSPPIATVCVGVRLSVTILQKCIDCGLKQRHIRTCSDPQHKTHTCRRRPQHQG